MLLQVISKIFISFGDFTYFNQPSEFERQHVMDVSMRRLFERLCGPGVRGWRPHQHAQDVHAAGVRHQFNLVKGVNGLGFFTAIRYFHIC